MLKMTFESMDPKLCKEFHQEIVKPHLEYAVQAWNPRLQGEIDKIESPKKGYQNPNWF